MTRLKQLQEQKGTLEDNLDEAKDSLIHACDSKQIELCERDIDERGEELNDWWSYNGKEYEELKEQN